MPGKTFSWARHCTKCLACAGNLQGCWPRMSFHWGRPCHGLWPGALGPSFNPNDNPLREVLESCSLLKGSWVTGRVRSWAKWWSWDLNKGRFTPAMLLTLTVTTSVLSSNLLEHKMWKTKHVLLFLYELLLKSSPHGQSADLSLQMHVSCNTDFNLISLTNVLYKLYALPYVLPFHCLMVPPVA